MKYLKLFEKFILESIRLKDLINMRFKIEIGSGEIEGIWNKNDLIEQIEDAIKHNLFDWNFYYNWTDSGEEYSKIFNKSTLSTLLKNPDKTLNTMFTFKNNKLTFNIQGNEATEWIDNWFKTNKLISKELKNDYYSYREEYAGIKL